MQGNMTKTERIDIFTFEAAERGKLSKESISKIIESGFFDAPASTRYHNNYDGGLFDHSLNVTRHLRLCTEYMDLKWERPQSPWIIGMLHDFCKSNMYTKDNETGLWKRNQNQTIPGHGIKSVIMLNQIGVDLTDEERLCIIHHMGAYEKDYWNEYGKSVEMYPNLLYVHLADMYASRCMEVCHNEE